MHNLVSAARPITITRYLITMMLLSFLARSGLSEDSKLHIPAAAQFGTPLSGEAIERLPKHVFANGDGLPAGQGDTAQGAVLYAQRCASCHGSQGQGGRAIELTGDRSLLNTEYPDRGIAVYWPNAPTLYEYIYRSMPPQEPASLTANELYSVIAHLLQLNGLLDEGSILNARLLSDINMPNHSGFETVGQ